MFIISQLWLTVRPRSTVVLPDTGTPGTSREIYSEDYFASKIGIYLNHELCANPNLVNNQWSENVAPNSKNEYITLILTSVTNISFVQTSPISQNSLKSWNKTS